MTQPDTPQPDESPQNACAQCGNARTLDSSKLRLMIITLRRALVAALKICDQLVEQLKTK